MKIALCLSGLAKGKNDIGRDSGGIEFSINHFRENLFNKYDVDVFVHSWSVNCEDEIHTLFNPKKAIIENQIIFDSTDIVVGNGEEEQIRGKAIANGVNPDKALSNYKPPQNSCQQCKSMLYSRKKSIELKREYEVENNFEYDFVLLSRFDVCFFSSFDFENLDKTLFYHSHNTDFLVDNVKTKYNQALIYKKEPHRLTKIRRNDFNTYGYVDFWFLSNSKAMDEFGKIFDYFDEYNSNPRERTHMGFLPCEKFTSKHLQSMRTSDDKLFTKTEPIKDRIIDYELVRRWHLDSAY